MKRLAGIVALLICVILPLSAASGTQGKKDYDTLVYAMNTEPARLDPQNDALLNTMLVNKQIYNTLVIKNPATGEIEPSLAKSWKWANDKTLLVTLRDDVLFHNGDKLTAEDVLYTIRRFPKGKATGSLFTSFDTENSRVVDATHIEIKLKETYGPALNMLTSMKAAIVNKKYCENTPEAKLNREPVGTGPFKFVSWVSGDRITLKRNDNYWGEKPSYSTLIMRVITDATARSIEVETGGVDIIDTLNGKDIDRFEGGVKGVKLYTVPGYKIHYITFNEKDPILSKEKVRLAFAHAINMKAVIKVAFGSSAIPATSSMATTIFGYKQEGFYELNPEYSKQLLKEAGYPDGFSTDIILPDVSYNIRLGEAMQAMLSQVGIKINIKIVDAATWQTMNREGKAMLSINNLTADTGDPDHSYTNLYGKSNMMSVKSTDPVVNSLLDKGRTELNEAKRKTLYGELQDYIFKHAIWIHMSEPIISFATRSYIENFIPDAGVQVDLSKINIVH